MDSVLLRIVHMLSWRIVAAQSRVNDGKQNAANILVYLPLLCLYDYIVFHCSSGIRLLSEVCRRWKWHERQGQENVKVMLSSETDYMTPAVLRLC